MKVSVRNGRAHISGYVNAVERYSKPITEEVDGVIRTFLERIKAGVFRTALARAEVVDILLNHDDEHVVARNTDAAVTLVEDNIGLRAELDTDDPDIVEKAKEGKLRGWSFGFFPNKRVWGSEGQYQTCTVTDLDLFEVSILTDSKYPAYAGTSIETRTEKGVKKMSIREENLDGNNSELLAAIGTLTEVMSELNNKLTPELIAALTSEERVDDETDEETDSTEESSEDEPTEEEAEESTEDEPTEEADDESDEESSDDETDDSKSDDEEQRSIDYSYFEERLSKI